MKNDYFIYKYEWDDGSVYIGQTSKSAKRYGVISEYRKCTKVYNKMIKHPNFKKQILKEGLNKESVDYFERYYIEYYKSFSKINYKGLNLTTGGQKNNHTVSNTVFKKGQTPWNKGLKLSDEIRQNYSKSHIGKKQSKEQISKKSKPINQYDLNNNFLKKWNSSREIERELKIHHYQVLSCCKNTKGYNSAGGFKWRYA